MNTVSYAKWVIKYRWFIILATFVLVFIAAAGMPRLYFSTDYRYFFSEENPELLAFEELQNIYTKNDNILFAIEPKDKNVFTPETLAVIEELTHASWQIPFSLRVDSITNFQFTEADGDDLMVGDLIKDAGSLSSEDIVRVKKIALNEPLLLNRLITEKTDITGVNVTINLPGKSITEVPSVVAFAREMADDIRTKHPDINVYLTGTTVMNNTFAEASQGDIQTLIPIMFLVILIIMVILLRSFAGTLATLLVILMSSLVAMGIAGWLNTPLTGISVIAPTIIMTLAVADSIHILVSMFNEMEAGKDKREALIESIRINMQPVFLTSFTTVIGFLSMNFSDAPPYHDLGNIVATGVVGAFIFSVLFLPAVIAVLPVRKRKPSHSGRFFDSFGEFVVRRKKELFWAMLVVIVGLTAGVSRIEINDVFVEYFDKRYTFRTDTDHVTENLTGIYQIGYSLSAGEDNGINDPEYLKNVESFSQWFKDQPGVVNVSTITDTMKRLNRSMHGDDDAYYRLPENKELAAQYLLLYEFSLPYGLDLNNQINLNKSATRFTATLEDMSTKDMLSLERRAYEWLETNFPESGFYSGSGTVIMFSHIAKRNIKSMFLGTGLALIIISLIMIFALRDVKVGLISLIPNLAPAFMAFGLWGIIFSQVGMALSVVTAMSLGIVVDDSVHFLTKYIRARREHNMSAEEAVCYSFRTVGKALWTSSVVLFAGFYVLTFSGFKLNSDMGLLTAIAIALALAADFLFLPPLLMKLERKKI
ncbi:MAG: MMPL family transporter [Proteobacteria bacterium]|nr:MMPL family transporter [Pseudomonadota bacterium]